jgi:hypothetical protein
VPSRVAVHCCCFATVAGNRGCTLDPARTRDPVIPMLMKEHKDLAGYVAREFAERGYWDAVPEYSPCSRQSCRIPHRVTRC